MKKDKLKNYEKITDEVLTTYPVTRGDDDLLYVAVLARLGYDYSRLAQMSAYDFLISYRVKGLPTIESIGRVRRKVQEENPSLLPDLNTKVMRKKSEKIFKNYAKSVDKEL